MSDAAVIIRAEDGELMFWCPGCGCCHGVWTAEFPHPISTAKWQFDGDFVRPTISPSILVRRQRDLTDDEVSRIMGGEKLDIPTTVCHSYVRDGKIQFLADCTHSLAGKTVPLEPMP